MKTTEKEKLLGRRMTIGILQLPLMVGVVGFFGWDLPFIIADNPPGVLRGACFGLAGWFIAYMMLKSALWVLSVVQYVVEERRDTPPKD